MAGTHAKTQNHDVRRQLFLGITKKIRSGAGSKRHEEDGQGQGSNNSHSHNQSNSVSNAGNATNNMTNSMTNTMSNSMSNTMNHNQNNTINNQSTSNQFLHPPAPSLPHSSSSSSSSRTLPKSPRSKRISQHLLTPTTTFHRSSFSSTSSAGEDSCIVAQDPVLSPPRLLRKDHHEKSMPQAKKFVLHKKEDIKDYDYHTFSSTRRLRTSKIKALEQAEVTTSLYFNFELSNNGIEDVLNEEDSNDPVICLPGLDQEASRLELEQLQRNFRLRRSRQ